MKKKFIAKSVVLLLVAIIVLSLLFYKEILNFLIHLDISNSNFMVIYVAGCFLYFFTPLPTTLIIILNGYFFKSIGFYLSLLLVFFGSTILFIFAKKIKNYFNLDLGRIFSKKGFNLSKLTTNNFSIFLSRYILPYFIHNIYYGLENIKIKKFIPIIICAEIPMLYALNSIGESLKNLSLNYKISYFDILNDKNFYYPFLIMFAILVVVNYLKGKFKK